MRLFIILLCLSLLCPIICACAEEVKVPYVHPEAFEVPDNEAMALLSDMGVGWNLGNTFDAYQDSGVKNELSMETIWCGVKTTREAIAAVRAAGYRTLRIPVSWHNHVTGEDFTISEAWLSRVQEVVDWGLAEGMYVILNIHHDDGEAWYYPSSQCYEASAHYLSCIWSQLAARFRDYDQHLIFECINEPRLKGHANEWYFDTGSAACRDAANCINRLNQVFVDIVRASGGANAYRYLMVPAYDASADCATGSFFSLPTDSADNRLIVSVHAYTPYSFALQDGGESRFVLSAAKQTGEITSFMNRLYNHFIRNGIPVVIGEFGARDKQGNLQFRVNYASFYTAAARARNLPCLWWDNGAFSGRGELFGLLRRQQGTWAYPEIVQAMVQYTAEE